MSASAFICVVAVLSLHDASNSLIDPGSTGSFRAAGEGRKKETCQGLCEFHNTGAGEVSQSECDGNANAVGKKCLRCDGDDYDVRLANTVGEWLALSPQNNAACGGFKLLGDCVVLASGARACANMVILYDEDGIPLTCGGLHKPLLVTQVGGGGDP